MNKDTKVTQVAKMQIREQRTHGRRAVARCEAKGKKKVPREKTDHVGLVLKQDTLQRGVDWEATTTCTLLMKILKKHMTMMKSCKCCVFFWKKAKKSSGKM